MSRMSAFVAVLVLVLPAASLAEEVVYQFRTEEDGSAQMEELSAACQRAPFRVNLRLAAGVYVPLHRWRDGRVVVTGHRRVGKALACAQLTDLAFPEGLTQAFYVRFELPEGRFTAVGQCTAVSNSVPRPGVVLTGCALKLTEFPEGYAGGFVTSSSLFNPFGLTGFNTGSYWTLRAFTREQMSTAQAGQGRSSMQWVEDTRSDAEIAALATAQ